MRLWTQGFPPKARLEDSIDLSQVAAQHPLSGGSIMNVVRYTCLQALDGGSGLVTLESLLQGIRREQIKEGKGA